MSVELGPGLITSIYDGIQRPLDDIMKDFGKQLTAWCGSSFPEDETRNGNLFRLQKSEMKLEREMCSVLFRRQQLLQQKIMVPYGVSGTVKEIKAGEFTVEEVVAVLETKDGDKELTMMQKWPVRTGRPYEKKLPPKMHRL